MSAIGRIIIVLNLLLSAAFMGFAANALSKSENYAQQLAEAKRDHDAAMAQKEDEISALQTQQTTLNDEKRDFREARDAADKKAQALESALAEQRSRNDQLEAQLTKISSSLSDFNDTISQLSSEKDAAVQARYEAESERDDANQKALAAELAARDAKEKADAAQARAASLQQQLDQTAAELARAKNTLTNLASSTNTDLASVSAMPAIDAKVLDIETGVTPALVMLNVGSEQGVQRGFVFDLYRGGQYKGQCRVADVEATYSSAVVTRSNPGTTIAQGDSASTNL